MNYLKKSNSISMKQLFKKMYSISFWVYTIVIIALSILTSSASNSAINWILDKTFLPETLKIVFKIVILIPISYWIGKYLIFNIMNIVFSTKTLFIYSSSSKFLSLINFLYSTKTKKEVFEPIVADWQEEYFEALFKKEIWKARWINVRYTYAFLITMLQKSPIGDLIEFISKIAK